MLYGMIIQCRITQGHWHTMNIQWLTVLNQIHAFAGGLPY